MTPTAADLLQQQSPLCQWAIGPDLTVHVIQGNTTEFLARESSELPNSNLKDILPPDRLTAWTDHIRRACAGEQFQIRETVRAAAGPIIYQVQHFPLRGPTGEVLFAGGIAQNINHLGDAEKELRETRVMILKAQEAERQRMALFLHDDVAQCMSVSGMQLDLLRMDLERDVPEISDRTAEIQAGIEAIMERIREYSYELNPSVVERAGLRWALDRLVGRMRRRSPATIRLMWDSTVHIPPPQAKAIYQIVQEALENSLTHSQCSLIELLLKSTRNGPVAEVRDNGRGFDAADFLKSQKGLGLLVMEHCAREAGLKLSVQSESPGGTAIVIAYESPAPEK